MDQFGWQLEIGSRVTIVRADHVGLPLLGMHGLIVGSDNEYVSLQLISATADRLDAIISIPPHHLEFGHIGPQRDAGTVSQETEKFDLTRVQKAVGVAVSEGWITRSQAKKIVSAWQSQRTIRS